MTLPGAGIGGAAGQEVSVAWHSTAVREIAGQAAAKLAAEYVAPARCSACQRSVADFFS